MIPRRLACRSRSVMALVCWDDNGAEDATMSAVLEVVTNEAQCAEMEK